MLLAESWNIWQNPEIMTNWPNSVDSGTKYTESRCQMWRFQVVKREIEKSMFGGQNQNRENASPGRITTEMGGNPGFNVDPRNCKTS